METVILSADAGGTATRAVVIDTSGQCLGYGQSGAGNTVTAGAGSAAAAIHVAIGQALADSGHPASAVDFALVALAGPENGIAGTLRERLSAAGMHGSLLIGSDLLAMFSSGGPELNGYGIVAGTGAAAVRVRNGQPDRYADGLGWLLGDAGSGFWIGHRVASAVAAALDGRAPATQLTDSLLRHYRINEQATLTGHGRAKVLELLIQHMYQAPAIELAQLAPLAFEAAQDAVASGIVTQAADALIQTYRSIAVADHAGPVILGGSVIARLAGLPAAISVVQHELGQEPDVRLVADGVSGSAVMALRQAGVTVGTEVFARISATVATRRAIAATRRPR